MADINVNKVAAAGASVADRAPAGPTPVASADPVWDIIELLFFAYRDFVGDPDEVLLKLELWPRASSGAPFRQSQSRDEGRRSA